jgi:peptidoglycan-associated lipoprotein
MKNIAIAIFINILLYGAANAQPLTTIPYQAHLSKAQEYADEGNYASQIEELEEAYKQKRDRSLLPIMADLYFRLRDYAKAENYYRRIVNRDKEGTNVEALFKLGQMAKMNGNYTDAAATLDSVIQKNVEPWSSHAKLELDGIRMVRQQDSIPDLTVFTAGSKVNGRSGEYSPVLYDGSLYFTSNSKESKEEPGDAYPVKVMKSVRNGESWDKPTETAAQVNNSSPVIGNISIDKAAGIMYLTKVRLKGEDVVESQIYYSKGDGDTWSDPLKVEGLFDSAIVKNPMPGELYGDKVLFFSSNASGGKGGFDLYYAKMLGEGKFDAPVNLGDQLNTQYDEITPFYDNGMLVFSSNGHPSRGGFDLFVTFWNGSTWSPVTNLGPGYNSYADDMYYTVSADGYSGFLVSNREGTMSYRSKTCCDDLFEFNIRKPEISADIFVVDLNKPLRGSTFTIMDESNPGAATTENDEKAYRYTYTLEMDKSYKVNVSKLGYFPDSIMIHTGGIVKDSTLVYKIELKPKPEVQVISINQPIRLNNIYYDYNDAKIIKESEDDLNYLKTIMDDNPTIVIELSSHTDSRGSDDYNLKLSQRRADAARDYLIKKGVAPDRIVAKGYGETQLLNKCANGVDCTDEEHRLNRRTEFKIISGPTSIEIKKQVTKERGQVIKTEIIKGK